jgi:GAF domain-containing protein
VVGSNTDNRPHALGAQERLFSEPLSVAGADDWEQALAAVARLGLGALADWCVVDYIDESGVVRRAAVEHASKDKRVQALAQEYKQVEPSIGAATMIARAIETRRAQRESDLTPERVAACLGAGAKSAALALGASSLLVVPLLARGRAVGALKLVRSRPGRPHGPEDVALAEDVARAAALAIDNARLLRRERRAVESMRQLQRVTASLSEAITPDGVA